MNANGAKAEAIYLSFSYASFASLALIECCE
jgi:hypothetical protein